MPLTQSPTMRPRHRILPDISGLTRDHQRRVRGALFRVAFPLKCRPSPRDAWDTLGDADCEIESMYLDKPVRMCRLALAAARRQGPDTLAEVSQHVRLFYAEMYAASMDGFETKTLGDIAREIRDMHREVADVQKAAADASYDNSRANLEALRIEGMQAMNEINDVVTVAATKLALVT